MYYGPYILRDAGFGEDSDRQLLINSIPLSTVGFLGALIAVFYSDKLGRRGMMLNSTPIIGTAMIFLSLSMYFIYG